MVQFHMAAVVETAPKLRTTNLGSLGDGQNKRQDTSPFNIFLKQFSMGETHYMKSLVIGVCNHFTTK